MKKGMEKKMHIELPEKVRFIINELEKAGYEAYAVGGCVRDSILGRIPDDWDITTSAKPLQVKAVFSRTIDTGIQHGTVTVMMDKEGFEVTTYRIDGEYEDSRHPKEVIFTSNLIEDLKRRDFTINAMAYNDRAGLIDVFEGMSDIERKCIRCVGNATERFTEDALRIMRAVRFSAQLGYTIEEETKNAIQKIAPNLQNISAERIQVELIKLLKSPHPDYLRVAYETGITQMMLPEFDKAMETEQNNPHHQYSVGEHTLHCILGTPSDKSLRLAALLHDLGKTETKSTDCKGVDHFYGHADVSEKMVHTILRRLKMDNDTITRTSKLVKYHDYDIEPNRRAMRRAINKIGEEYMADLFVLKEADMLAQSLYKREEKQKLLSELKRIYQEVIEAKECVSLKTLAINGKDLIEVGIKPGKNLGDILDCMLQDVLDDPSHNTPEYLMDHMEEFLLISKMR